MPDLSRIWRPGRLRSHVVRVAGVSFLAATAVAGTSLSPAAGAVSRPAHSAADMAGELHAVWCTGASNCVAVGDNFSQGGGNGEPTPNPTGASFTFLQGVACTSGSNCWAAGEWGSPTGPRTLIEHWNGRAWSVTA